eukprot:176344-Chlamydomonas_euryale.AAC.6
MAGVDIVAVGSRQVAIPLLALRPLPSAPIPQRADSAPVPPQASGENPRLPALAVASAGAPPQLACERLPLRRCHRCRPRRPGPARCGDPGLAPLRSFRSLPVRHRRTGRTPPSCGTRTRSPAYTS